METENKFNSKYGSVFKRLGKISYQVNHLSRNSNQMSKITDLQLPLINRHPSRYFHTVDSEGRQEFYFNDAFSSYVAASWAEGKAVYRNCKTGVTPQDQEKTLNQDPAFSKLMKLIRRTGRTSNIEGLITPLVDKFFNRSLTEKEYRGILDDSLEEIQEVNKYIENRALSGMNKI
jgi:hypothetical protein